MKITVTVHNAPPDPSLLVKWGEAISVGECFALVRDPLWSDCVRLLVWNGNAAWEPMGEPFHEYWLADLLRVCDPGRWERTA